MTWFHKLLCQVLGHRFTLTRETVRQCRRCGCEEVATFLDTGCGIVVECWPSPDEELKDQKVKP